MANSVISDYITPVIYTDHSGNSFLLGILGFSTLAAISSGIAAAIPIIATIVIVVLIAVVIWQAFELVDTIIDVYSAKKSKDSQKERATDKPSYVNRGDIDKNLSAHDNAKNMMNKQWGPGNWNRGPGSDFNKTVKWIVRGGFLKQLITSTDFDSEYEGNINKFDYYRGGLWIYID